MWRSNPLDSTGTNMLGLDVEVGLKTDWEDEVKDDSKS